MSPLPGGAFRLAFRAADATISPAAQATLAEIGRRLAASLSPGLGRVTVEAQASGPAQDASAARRLSLARAQAVRDGLAAGGLAPNLIDVSPLGRQPAGLDAADILPPGAARASRR
jgi:outer membrane protein OmpA-like peptidoglycan-associated protein